MISSPSDYTGTSSPTIYYPSAKQTKWEVLFKNIFFERIVCDFNRGKANELDHKVIINLSLVNKYFYQQLYMRIVQKGDDHRLLGLWIRMAAERLFTAIQHGGDYKSVNQLIAAGVSVNISRPPPIFPYQFCPYQYDKDNHDFNSSPFTLAVHTVSPGVSPELFSALINAGANINKDFIGTKLLISMFISRGVCTRTLVPLMQDLFHAGVDVNAHCSVRDFLGSDFSGSALMAASMVGNEEAVKLLIAAKADVTAKNSQGETALKIAKSSLSKEDEIIRILKEASPPSGIKKVVMHLFGQKKDNK